MGSPRTRLRSLKVTSRLRVEIYPVGDFQGSRNFYGHSGIRGNLDRNQTPLSLDAAYTQPGMEQSMDKPRLTEFMVMLLTCDAVRRCRKATIRIAFVYRKDVLSI